MSMRMQSTFLLLVVLNAYELPGEYVDMLITYKMVEASAILNMVIKYGYSLVSQLKNMTYCLENTKYWKR